MRPMIIVRILFLNPTKAGAKGDCRKIRGTDGSLQMPGFDEQEVRRISDALHRMLEMLKKDAKFGH